MKPDGWPLSLSTHESRVLYFSLQAVPAKEVLLPWLKKQQKRIYLLFPDVQQQSDPFSCGLFSLAYAQTMCVGEDPAETHYDHSKLRPHYLQCLQDRRTTPFPSPKRRGFAGTCRTCHVTTACTCTLCHDLNYVNSFTIFFIILYTSYMNVFIYSLIWTRQFRIHI